MIILAPAFGKFLSSCSVHIGMYNLCYIRTTRTHKHSESGHVQSPTSLEFSPASQRAHIPCSFPSSSAFFRMYLPPPTRTNKHRQNRETESDRQASRKAGNPPRLLSSLHLFFTTQDNDSQKRGPNSLFHHAHIFLPFFFLCALGFFWCEREVSNTASSSSEGNSERRFFSCSSFVYVSE
jgi:hypothetical protein